MFLNSSGLTELVSNFVAANLGPKERKPKGPCIVQRIAAFLAALPPKRDRGALENRVSIDSTGTDQPLFRRSTKRLGTIVQVLMA
jgi:hypothetical protein